ncbi:2'-5' RNA ligase family protein [Moraxella pluranimalium]|uniref:2'-5' RNA ligase n=1 Tax=Moraxella pluranimalium TaxID=470453 RepID=A0A1T0CJD0_9GAMM|nr:2'-5' RNA ligase family protein [Moraxella pluranimalium]OOS22458.1 hypothetical protein B0680_09390 [Moraxella pluranimalium]
MTTPTAVSPLTTADYQKWHKGRRHYGVWYIPIDDDKVVAYCQSLRDELGELFADNYRRQWHITLFVNGFYVDNRQYDDDFDECILTNQINDLQNLQLSRFHLTTQNLGSFINCAYVGVKMHPALMQIRQHLGNHHQEIAPLTYTPHITLGLYRHAFDYDAVINRLNSVATTALDIPVNRLMFATFDATDLQGKLYNQHEIRLK